MAIKAHNNFFKETFSLSKKLQKSKTKTGVVDDKVTAIPVEPLLKAVYKQIHWKMTKMLLKNNLRKWELFMFSIPEPKYIIEIKPIIPARISYNVGGLIRLFDNKYLAGIVDNAKQIDAIKAGILSYPFFELSSDIIIMSIIRIIDNSICKYPTFSSNRNQLKIKTKPGEIASIGVTNEASDFSNDLK